MEEGRRQNEVPGRRIDIRAFFDRWKTSGSLLLAAVLFAAVLLSAALINQYRLRQAAQLVDAGEYHAARLQLDAMLPLFEGDRVTQYQRVRNLHAKDIALPLREMAADARQRAKDAGAPRLAPELWADGMFAYNAASREANHGEWSAAGQSWEYAAEAFEHAHRRAVNTARFLSASEQMLH